MLVRLFGSNFGVFRDEFSLSLEAKHLPSDEGRGYFEVGLKGEAQPLRLLRLAAIYGANGSGKSTVVRAAQALRDLAIGLSPGERLSDTVPGYLPFALDGNREEVCSLGCEVVLAGEVWSYRVRFCATQIEHEDVRVLGSDEDRVLLSRDGASLRVFLPDADDKLTSLLERAMRPNTTALATAALFNDQKLRGLYRFFRRGLHPTDALFGRVPVNQWIIRAIRDNDGLRTWMEQHLLPSTDLGIDRILIRETSEVHGQWDTWDEESAEPGTGIGTGTGTGSGTGTGGSAPVQPRLEMGFTHKGGDGRAIIDLGLESDGTRKMIALAPLLYWTTTSDRTLLVDELSASLHPALLGAVLQAVNRSAGTGQLIFTTHDPSAMDGVLRRDQVYFTEKGPDGAATLYSLADFRERQTGVTNPRKRYMEGRYGAIPRVGPIRFDGPQASGAN